MFWRKNKAKPVEQPPDFVPLPDITAYELSQMIGLLTRPHSPEFFRIRIAALTPELKRHFRFKVGETERV